MITKSDLERWKENSLETALEMGLKEERLSFISCTDVEVISRDDPILPRTLLPPFYGGCDPKERKIFVIDINYSKYMSDSWAEMYNQTGMDHELIGHIYNFWIGDRFDEWPVVRMQNEMLKFRMMEDKKWMIPFIASKLIQPLRILLNWKVYH